MYEVYAALVDEYGFNPDNHDVKGTEGNIVAIQNVMDGFKLQPCNPSFVNARDAILQADKARYGGKHACTMWKAFAKRGLGSRAKSRVYKNSKNVPADCKTNPDTPQKKKGKGGKHRI